MAHILVTGGGGYIGSILVPALLREGHVVTVLDNFMYKQTSLMDVLHNGNLSVVRGDARDERLLQHLMERAEYIIPLACIVGAPACKADPDAARTVNLDAIKTILRLRSRGQKIIFPNTNSGYGIGQEGIFCTEETPLLPVSLYGQLKVEAEKRILDAGDAITFRLATVFGISPRMRLDLLVNDFVYRAHHDRAIVIFEPNFKRNYIHIRDVARAFLHGIENFDRMKNNAYNVGLSDANLSKAELCAEIQNYVPSFVYLESPIGEDPDKRNYIVSNEKIEKTGFIPTFSLQHGIQELLKGYQIIYPTAHTNL